MGNETGELFAPPRTSDFESLRAVKSRTVRIDFLALGLFLPGFTALEVLGVSMSRRGVCRDNGIVQDICLDAGRPAVGTEGLTCLDTLL
jgi:hypothetical protein